MQTSHVHGVEIGFHHGTEDAHTLFQHADSRHELQRHLTDAGTHGEAHFYVGRNLYKVSHEEHGGKTIPVIEKIANSHHVH